MYNTEDFEERVCRKAVKEFIKKYLTPRADLNINDIETDALKASDVLSNFGTTDNFDNLSYDYNNVLAFVSDNLIEDYIIFLMKDKDFMKTLFWKIAVEEFYNELKYEPKEMIFGILGHVALSEQKED